MSIILTQFYSTSNSSEEGTSLVKKRAVKAYMKDKEKQEKPKMVQEVAGDNMSEGKNTTKEKKDKASNEKKCQRFEEGRSIHAN